MRFDFVLYYQVYLAAVSILSIQRNCAISTVFYLYKALSIIGVMHLIENLSKMFIKGIKSSGLVYSYDIAIS